MQPYSSTNNATTLKNSHSISSVGFDFHIVVHAFTKCILTVLSGDEIFPSQYVNWSTNFKGLSFNEEMAPSWFNTHELCFIIKSQILLAFDWTNQSTYKLRRISWIQWGSLSDINTHCCFSRWVNAKRIYSDYILMATLFDDKHYTYGEYTVRAIIVITTRSW